MQHTWVDMTFEPTNLLAREEQVPGEQVEKLPGNRWTPVLQHGCDFDDKIFCDVSMNLIQNPNVTSSHLFRADILSDSYNGELVDADIQPEDVDRAKSTVSSLPLIEGFSRGRTLIRKLIPRNPQLDRPIAQVCWLLGYTEEDGTKHNVTILQPDVERAEDLPWYHPAVRSLAYWHSWKPRDDGEHSGQNATTADAKHAGTVTLYYQLFPDQDPGLTPRLQRTALNLLSVLYKHGQGSLAGYTKKVHHDQIISQQRVQNTYTALKTKYAKDLCNKWVEQTEPSKHVFEDLGIAAFLIELWKDMYAHPDERGEEAKGLPPFPGFVDIGCGNGVLTEILLQEGYRGQGFDARQRKTWSILSPKAQASLSETLFVPQPLFDLYPADASSAPSSFTAQTLLARARSLFSVQPYHQHDQLASSLVPPRKRWHNLQFPTGTFIISNHADELTPWTPLMAYLCASPFLAIPCCSHNLSGDRFRAPSAHNSNTADSNAPAYFAANKPKTRAKSIAITIPYMDETGGNDDDDGSCAQPAFGPASLASPSKSTRAAGTEDDTSAGPPSSSDPRIEERLSAQLDSTSLAPSKPPSVAAETGDLKKLSQQARAKQPSAYAALCEWVVHLSREVGFEVEREMLRIPSTRNVGLVGRTRMQGFENQTAEERRAGVLEVINKEGADGKRFVARCEGVCRRRVEAGDDDEEKTVGRGLDSTGA
jgi:tRNASer (uridine44-2'-O)-methyltransferase